jgi:hypothetical protein
MREIPLSCKRLIPLLFIRRTDNFFNSNTMKKDVTEGIQVLAKVVGQRSYAAIFFLWSSILWFRATMSES